MVAENFDLFGSFARGKVAAHVDEAQSLVLLAGEAGQGLDSGNGVVLGDLDCLLPRHGLQL